MHSSLSVNGRKLAQVRDGENFVQMPQTLQLTLKPHPINSFWFKMQQFKVFLIGNVGSNNLVFDYRGIVLAMIMFNFLANLVKNFPSNCLGVNVTV